MNEKWLEWAIEFKEEAGLDVKVDKIIAVQDRAKHNSPVYAYGVCKIFALCTVIGGKFADNIIASIGKHYSISITSSL